MADPAASNDVRPEDIEALVAEFEASPCSELHVRFDGFELHLSSDPATVPTQVASAPVPVPSSASATAAPGPVTAAAPAIPPAAMQPTQDDLGGLTIVRAPYLGSFYRAPKPGEPPYVEIGSEVEATSDLCLIEVMKLFTAVRAGVAGRIARVLATDGVAVEAGDPLFAIEPIA